MATAAAHDTGAVTRDPLAQTGGRNSAARRLFFLLRSPRRNPALGFPLDERLVRFRDITDRCERRVDARDASKGDGCESSTVKNTQHFRRDAPCEAVAPVHVFTIRATAVALARDPFPAGLGLIARRVA